MKTSSVQVLCATVLLALALSIPHSVHADARRAGLAGNLLIEDHDDLYFFPQRMLAYPDLVALTYGANAGSGNGLLTLGNDSFAFGIALHRGDVLSPHLIDDLAAVNGPSSLFGGTFGIDPATIFDLLFGMRTGGGDLGFRLSAGSARVNQTTMSMDTGQSDTFLMGEVGYGWGKRGESTRVDLSAALTLDLASQQAADVDTSSGTHFGVSTLMRAYVPMDRTLDLGVLANAQVMNTSISNELAAGKPSASVLAINAGAGVGPAFRFGRAQVAGYGILRVHVENDDPSSDVSNDDITSHAVVLPGMQMAVEVPLTEWFIVRSGAEYSFNIHGTSTGAPLNNGMSGRDGTFGWNAGLGIWIDQFRFDGSVQHGFVTGGPNFIGGTASGFLAIATLTYSFEKARREALEVHAPPPPPPPAPPPPPPPPPVVEPEPEPEPVAAEPEPEAIAPPAPLPQPSGRARTHGGRHAAIGASATTPLAPAQPAAPAVAPLPAAPPATR